jgi:N utilization substance protein B
LINQSIKKLFTYFNAPLNVFQQVSFLVIGTITNIKKIDNSIKKYSFKWKIERLSKIDRNILRIASYELFLSSKMPKAVILNEAIEISKKFGDTKSSSFVNGVLNAISIYARNK